ncbi:hypothetical protein [Bradyrhizobium lablabi]|uniref:hypothetical protein n=1 Tax=Bradyrhizobium lablabi TaxID=722472 RepID=UPI001BA91393|nr:hypothetical protein [Bradyrhizobium lablabi]MBR0692004.1 hypothetical protein [Bradyrhizobium lablabi]
MPIRAILLVLCFLADFSPAAQALTLDEIKTKLAAAGYSNVREVPSGKIRIFKATKDGQERSVVVDSTGHIKELQ